MSARLLYLSAVSTLVISACATSQENPNYKYSTKYKAATPYQTAATLQTITPTTQPVTYVSSQQATYNNNVQTQPAAPIVYQNAQTNYSRVDHKCLSRETNRELLGGAIGGTVGAIAGKKLVGGTKGTLLGAAIGGTAGYGIGDKSINCDPIQMPVTQASSVTTQPYPGQTYQVQPQPQYQPQYQYQQPQTQTQYGTTYAATSTSQAPAQMPVVQAPQANAPQTYTAPTDQAYGDTYGTPGYHAVMASQGQAPIQTQPQAQPQLQVQAYAAPQPTYTPPQMAYVPSQPTYAPQQPVYHPQQMSVSHMAGNLHEVIEGDTVYSMSKRLCVTPQDIQQINGLDAQFNIKLGEHIRLPTSRC